MGRKHAFALGTYDHGEVLPMIGIILAAGKGTRMKPYSNAVNKEMSLIGNYPVIEYNVKALAGAGVKKAFVVLSESKWQVLEYLRDGSQFGLSLSFIYQDMSRGKGTARAIQTAEPWVDEDFIVVYGDSFFHPLDFFKEALTFHDSSGADATMGAYMMKDHKDYGVLKLEGEDVIDILEKASDREVKSALLDGMFAVNSGPLIFRKEAFGYMRRTPISSSGEYWITDTLRLMIGDKKKVMMYRIPEGVFWRDIGRMEHRVEAEEYLIKMRVNSDESSHR